MGTIKIFQIHKYGGQWEDAYDCIVKSYAWEEDAITELTRLKEKADKCSICSLKEETESLEVAKHCCEICDECAINDEEGDVYYCQNVEGVDYFDGDAESFRIREEDLIL